MADKIKEPHAHDVLSGRGNFVNYHDGNEYFRKLVRKHKLDYVNCPKQQKGKFSKLIVDEIKGRNPPGRFLKQDRDSKLWYDIGEKKALDKTRQALREGAPELMNNGKGSSSKDESAGADTTFNKPPIDQQHMSHGELSILQQSIMSIGNDSFHQSGGLMGHNPYNMQGIGLSPNVLYISPGGGSNNKDNGRLGNRPGGIDLSQIIPPPEVHSNEQNLLQQQRKEQEQQLQQLRYLQQQRQQQEQQQQQQQQQQRQSRQSHFTSQQEQEIIRNATAVMGNDFQKSQQHQNQTKMHMDQLRINKLKEKRKLLEQQIMHQRQLEILELKKLQNQQKLNEYQQQNEQQQHPTSAEMRGALQNRLGAVYAGTDILEPTPMPGSDQKQILPPSQSNGTSSSLDITGDLAGGTDDHTTVKDRRSGLVRENSLKMESIFENPGAPVPPTTNPKKNFNMSASGMSMSGTSLSLGFDEESELSALFDTSMKIEGAVARGYATTLNDRGDGNTPRSPKPIRSRGNSSSVSGNLLGNTALLGMSMTSIGAEKSNSSMSCDSSLSRLFDDTGTPSK